MIKWIIGGNSAGKTLFLTDEHLMYKSQNIRPVTNLSNASKYIGFCDKRVELLSSDYVCEELLDYNRIIFGDTSLILNASDGYRYTTKFISMLTLLCRKGSVLLLDEPEMGLPWNEINLLSKIFYLLLPTFDEGTIVTHCSSFFHLALDNCYYYKDYDLTKIEEDDLYGYIAKF